MPEDIDFKFLSDLEGGSRTDGYVPAAGVSKSGVTIATGFDLGQRGEADLNGLNLGDSLVAKLKPYLGKKGDEARVALEEAPLAITGVEADEIDKAVKSAHIASIEAKYDEATGGRVKFIDLPPEAQTVIASVSFQYGTALDRRTPMFWRAVTAQDWEQTIGILNDFGDAYPTRRKKEAALLEKIA